MSPKFTKDDAPISYEIAEKFERLNADKPLQGDQYFARLEEIVSDLIRFAVSVEATLGGRSGTPE